MLETVPLLDLEQFNRSEDDRIAFANSLGLALTSVGFIRLRGHPVPGALLSACYEQANAFFSQPEAYKRALISQAGDCQRGYTPFGTEHAIDEPRVDLKEFLMIGRARYGDNIWPKDAPGFDRPFLDLFYKLERVGVTVLEALALYLALDDDTFSGLVMDGNSSLRVIHYPPIDESVAAKFPGSERSAKHADINMLTVMPSSTAAGLQIFSRDGTWIDVPSHPGELIVNTGDMLAEMTNNAIKPTVHRVINLPGSAGRASRYSMPCFVHARAEALLEVPAPFRTEPWPQPRPTRTAGEALAERLAAIGNKTKTATTS